MKRLLPAAALLAILASAVVATSASAAKPHAIKTSWLCNPFSTTLTPMSRLLGSSTARGEVAREPSLADTAERFPATPATTGRASRPPSTCTCTASPQARWGR